MPLTGSLAAFAASTRLICAFGVDGDGLIGYVNNAASQRLGRDAAAVCGTSFYDLLTDDAKRRATQLLTERLGPVVLEFDTDDGRRVALLVHAVPAEHGDMLLLGEPDVPSYMRLGEELIAVAGDLTVAARERAPGRPARGAACGIAARCALELEGLVLARPSRSGDTADLHGLCSGRHRGRRMGGARGLHEADDDLLEPRLLRRLRRGVRGLHEAHSMRFDLAQEVRSSRAAVAAKVTAEFLDRHPDWRPRYGERARVRGEEDAAFSP